MRATNNSRQDNLERFRLLERLRQLQGGGASVGGGQLHSRLARNGAQEGEIMIEEGLFEGRHELRITYRISRIDT